MNCISITKCNLDIFLSEIAQLYFDNHSTTKIKMALRDLATIIFNFQRMNLLELQFGKVKTIIKQISKMEFDTDSK